MEKKEVRIINGVKVEDVEGKHIKITGKYVKVIFLTPKYNGDIIKLSNAEKEEVRAWRIYNCGSPRFKDFFDEFTKQMKKI